jgi:hypothetical protein
MQLDGIPDSITRSAYLNLISDIGRGQFHLDDLFSLTLGADAIRVEVIAKDADGQPIVNKLTGSIELHTIVIPVVAD